MPTLDLTFPIGTLASRTARDFREEYARRYRTLFLIAACCFSLLRPSIGSATDLSQLEEIIDESRLTFARFVGHPSMSWFRDRARNARAIFIAPRITKASYLFGGTWGTGVVLIRNLSTGQWSQPAFYRLTGASFGLQIGALNSEIVAVATDDQAAGEMQDGAFTLGLSGKLGFGRMGGGISRSLDITSGTGYVTVGTTSGVFAGIAAGATLVLVKNGANELYYGRPVELNDLLESRVRNWYSDRLIQTVRDLAAGTGASQP
jgi:lipid-binding SYLF domain-containing protein